MKKFKKIIITTVIVLVVIIGIIFSLRYLKKKNTQNKVADVYPVMEMTIDPSEFGMSENYGNVNTSFEQKVYITGSQKVNEVKVKEGDVVKAGDVLMVYDTTSRQLDMEIKRTALEVSRARIQSAKFDLTELENTEPVEETTETVTEEPTTEEPTTEEPTTEEPTTEEVTTETATTEQVTTEEGATTEEVTTEEITTEEVTTEEPTTEEPTTEEPTTEEIDDDFDELDDSPVKMTYTRKELDRAIKEKRAEIRTMEVAYELEVVEYQIMVHQNANGEVYCNFDGVVKSVIDEEEAAQSGSPMIVVGTDKGYVVEATIGELALSKVCQGDPVSMMCYNDGMQYTGKITEISTFPTESMGYNYDGSTQSYYLVKIAIDDADYMEQGSMMSITYDTLKENENSLYIMMQFVRKENGRYYVLKNIDGYLKKEYVVVGKIMYGQYCEIVNGVSSDDMLAFPYLSDVKEGMSVEVKSVSDLYGY